MPTYHGSCHCGAVRFTVEGPIDEAYTCALLTLREKERAHGQRP